MPLLSKMSLRAGMFGVSLTILSGCASADLSFDQAFPKELDVFGVSIRASKDTPDDKILHAANILAEYLDNNEDGVVDNPLLVSTMVDKKATLVMTPNGRMPSGFSVESLPKGRIYQDLYGKETHPGGRERGVFDGALEEVLHLVTHGGYAHAYPDVFGEYEGTVVGGYMDKVRGGHFTSIPDKYPEDAFYSYYDQTCDYGCMIAEYMYWSITSILGAQNQSWRENQIGHEWKLNTPEKNRKHNSELYMLLKDPEYKFPQTLPEGNYAAADIKIGSTIVSKRVDADQVGSDYLSKIDISYTALKIGDDTEYDFRIMIMPEEDGNLTRIDILFPDGHTSLIGKERVVLTEGREHETGMLHDEEMNMTVWQYINIALPGFANYGVGEYRITARGKTGNQTILVPVTDPELVEGLSKATFPEIVSPADTKVSSPVTFSIKPVNADAQFFAGMAAKLDGTRPLEGQDFFMDVQEIIPAGSSTTTPQKMQPGQWGGDIVSGISKQGNDQGVDWSVSVGAGATFELTVER